MTTDIERRKSWALIGILAFISITVNAAYAHVHRRYQNGSDFVQRTQHGQPAPIVTAPTKHQVSVSYAPTEQWPGLLPVMQDAPAASDSQAIQTRHSEHLSDEEKRLQKQERMEQRKDEREQKQEAREAAATNDAVSLNTNAVETAKGSKETEHDRNQALSPKEKDQIAETRREAHDAERTSNDSMPQIAREQGKNSERFGGSTMRKAVDTKTATSPKESEHYSTPAPALKGSKAANIQTPRAKEVAAASAATPPLSEGKTAKPQNDIKTPPNAPSHAVLERIWRGFVTGGQSGDQYENQNSRHDSKQQGHNQDQKNQTRRQNQQNGNNGNNGGGGGGGRRR